MSEAQGCFKKYFNVVKIAIWSASFFFLIWDVFALNMKEELENIHHNLKI